MKRRLIGSRGFIFFGGLMAVGLLPSWTVSQQTAPAEGEAGAADQRVEGEDVEVLLRGPLHEAFAQPVDFEAEPGLTVRRQPPEPIEELPPEYKPDEGAIWISGYWAWDDDRDDFIWISGLWRVPPENRRWVPGYWDEADGGYQWISGFWAPADTDELSYLPNPPDTLESGPTSEAPADGHFWISGSWIFQDVDYVWRPGYWAPGYDNWVWVPDRYVWTPHGCIHVGGYWDYPFIDRGMCFAPVYYHTHIYRRPRYYYAPTTLLDLAHLTLHLFVRPSYGHYYFGDWYGGGYRNYGLYAPFAYHGRHGWDPIFTHQRWYYSRRGLDYAHRLRVWHRYLDLDDHRHHRPPHTWSDRQEFVRNNRDFRHIDNVLVAQQLQDAVAGRREDFRRIAAEQRRQASENARQMQRIVDARDRAERFARDALTDDGRRERADQDALRRRAAAERQRLRLPETPDVEQIRRFAQERAERARETLRPPTEGRLTDESRAQFDERRQLDNRQRFENRQRLEDRQRLENRQRFEDRQRFDYRQRLDNRQRMDNRQRIEDRQRFEDRRRTLESRPQAERRPAQDPRPQMRRAPQRSPQAAPQRPPARDVRRQPNVQRRPPTRQFTPSRGQPEVRRGGPPNRSRGR